MTVEVDLGGAEFLSLVMGNEALKSSEFTLSGNELTISRTAIEMRCSDGDNLLTLNTTVTSADFILNCYYSDATPVFDATKLKMQGAAGSDVRFRFNPYAQDYTVSVYDEESGSYEALKDGAYSYSSNQLTIAASYLDEQYCDFINLRVSVADEAQTSFAFCVVPYGKGDSAHPAAANAYAVNNFDTLETGSTFCGSDTETEICYSQGSANTVVAGASAIDGKSLSVSSQNGVQVNTLLGFNLGFKKDTTYYIELKYKVSEGGAGSTQIIFKWQGVGGTGESNFLWMNGDASVQSKEDSRTTADYDAATGVVTVKMFTSTSVAQNVFQILTLGNSGEYDVVFDDLRILETAIPVDSGYNPPSQYDYNSKSGSDLEIDTLCSGTQKLVSIECGGVALVQNSDYTLLSDGTAVLKASWLAKQEGDFTLRLTSSYVNDIFGGRTEQSADVSVTLIDKQPAVLTGDSMKVQTAAGEDLTYTVSLGEYTFEGVELGGVALQESAYTFADGLLTIKASTLDSMTAGLYDGKILLSEGNYLPFSVGVYGTDEVHLAPGIGVQNFENYELGATLGDIYGGAVTCWPDLNNKAVSVVRDSALGKVLSIPSSVNGAGILDFKNMEAGSVYRVTLKFRTENDEPVKSLLLKWLNANLDASWIKSNAIDQGPADLRTTLTKDEATGVYTWVSYLKPTTVSGDSLILWSVEAQGLYIGSIEIVKTDLTFVSASESTYRYYDGTSFVASGEVTFSSDEEELTIVYNPNVPAPFSFVGLYAGDTALTEGVDYRRDGDLIKLLPAYLEKIEDSVTLTLRRSVNYMDGTPLIQSAAVTVTKAQGSLLTGNTLAAQSSSDSDVTYTLDIGGFAIESVLCEGNELGEADYTYADGTLTVKAACLADLTAGLHELQISVSDGKTFTVYVAVYGNESAHLAEGIGAQNFADAGIGATLQDVYGGRVRSEQDQTNSQIKIVEDEDFGKALYIPGTITGARMIEFTNLKAGVVYCVTIRMKTENDANIDSLLFKWLNSEKDTYWIENNALKDLSSSDIRSSVSRNENGIWTLTMYTCPADRDDVLFLWNVAGNALGLLIGSIEFVETDLELVDRITYGTYNYYTGSAWVNDSTVEFSADDQALSVIGNINMPEIFTFEGIFAGEKKLSSGTDYVVENSAVILQPEYLGTIDQSVTLIIRRSVPLMDGSSFRQEAQVTVTRTA